MDGKLLAAADRMDFASKACCFVTGFVSMFHMVFFIAGFTLAGLMFVGLHKRAPLKASDGLRFHGFGLAFGLLWMLVPR